MKTNEDSQEQTLTDTNRNIPGTREEIIQENHLVQGANSCETTRESTENNHRRNPHPTVSAVQEVSEIAVEESEESRPSSDLETLLLRRGQVDQLIQTHTRTRQGLDTEIQTLQSQPRARSSPASHLIAKDQEALRNCVAHYGTVSGMDEGSIVIRILLGTLEGLEELRQNFNNKILAQCFQTCLREKTSLASPSSTFENFTVKIDLTSLDRIKTYLEADELSEDVSYTFCPEQKTWFWSVDRVSWQHVDQFLVTSGEFKGKKPKQEDVETLLKFNLLNDDPKVMQKQKDCFCCRKGLLHEGASVSPLKPPNEIDVKISWDNMKEVVSEAEAPSTKLHSELNEAVNFLLDKMEELEDPTSINSGPELSERLKEFQGEIGGKRRKLSQGGTELYHGAHSYEESVTGHKLRMN